MAVPADIRWFLVRNRKALQTSIQRLRSLPFENVIIGHGAHVIGTGYKSSGLRRGQLSTFHFKSGKAKNDVTSGALQSDARKRKGRLIHRRPSYEALNDNGEATWLWHRAMMALPEEGAAFFRTEECLTCGH